MTHAEAFSLDRAVSEWTRDVVRRFNTAPSPFNLAEAEHPTLFAVEPGPDDYEAAIREDERRAAHQIHIGLIAENHALKDELRQEREAHESTKTEFRLFKADIHQHADHITARTLPNG